MINSDIKIIENKQITSAVSFSSEEIDKYSSCAVKNGLRKDTVIFVYSNSCPHCLNMQPIVSELELDGYNFEWASVSDSESKELLRECFSDVLAGGVPQFICAKNGEIIVGEKSKSILEDFVESCK